MKTKVAHITTDLINGAVSKLIHSYVRHSDPANYDLSVIDLNYDKIVRKFRSIDSKKENLSGQIEKTGTRIFSIEFNLILPFRLYRILKSNRFDVIHTHNRVASIITRLTCLFLKRPVIITTEHNTSNWQSRGIKYFLDKLLLPVNKHFIAVSDGVRQAFLARNTRYHKRISTINNGIEIQPQAEKAISGTDLHTTLNLDASLPIIGTVARLDPRKGLNYLVEATKILFDKGLKFHLVIAGGGSASVKEELETQIKTLQLTNCSLLGHLDQIDPIYRQLDIFVLPSTSEGFGISILEAMNHKIPVVASDIGGISEIIDDGVNGILVPAKDPAKLAMALEKLLRNQSLRDEFREKGHAKLHSRYTAAIMVQESLKIYEKYLMPKR